MAKNRDDRYPSTEDMLEDLRLVRKGEPPIHARRQIDIDSLENLGAQRSNRGSGAADLPPGPHLDASVGNRFARQRVGYRYC